LIAVHPKGQNKKASSTSLDFITIASTMIQKSALQLMLFNFVQQYYECAISVFYEKFIYFNEKT